MIRIFSSCGVTLVLSGCTSLHALPTTFGDTNLNLRLFAIGQMTDATHAAISRFAALAAGGSQ